jgi:hypothetical protein
MWYASSPVPKSPAMIRVGCNIFIGLAILMVAFIFMGFSLPEPLFYAAICVLPLVFIVGLPVSVFLILKGRGYLE